MYDSSDLTWGLWSLVSARPVRKKEGKEEEEEEEMVVVVWGRGREEGRGDELTSFFIFLY